jgi:hypothetical protein
VFTKSLVAMATAGGLLLPAAPALADDAGLYGSADPTFDGAYRHSLSILALTAANATVPASAVAWLKAQQCDDGGYQAYRPDTTASCLAPDAANYAGQDSNSTALAAAALWHTGQKKQARKAAQWLERTRNSDGGWAYYPAPGATSDANSSALAHSALRLLGRTSSPKYLRGLQSRCDAPRGQRGGLAFDATTPGVNDNSTAATAWLLGGGLTLADPGRIGKSTPGLICKGSKAGKGSVPLVARGYLAKRLLAAKGDLPYGGGYPGTDYAGAASATIALANAGVARRTVRTATRFLRRSGTQWITASGGDSPGALAMLILVAHSTGQNPRDFGDVNLVARLATTRTS